MGHNSLFLFVPGDFLSDTKYFLGAGYFCTPLNILELCSIPLTKQSHIEVKNNYPYRYYLGRERWRKAASGKENRVMRPDGFNTFKET